MHVGMHVHACTCMYGVSSFELNAGTYRFFYNILSNYGIETTFIDTTDLKLLEDSIKPNTKVRTVVRCALRQWSCDSHMILWW